MKPNECIMQMDFAENFSLIIQDEVQSFYFSKNQATFHPFVIYVQSLNGNQSPETGTAHGKSACDGIGGTVKRVIHNLSLQRPIGNQILTLRDMFLVAKEKVKNIRYMLLSKCIYIWVMVFFQIIDV